MQRFSFSFFVLSFLFSIIVAAVTAQPALVHAQAGGTGTTADPYGLEGTRKQTPQYANAKKTLPELIGSVISVALSLIGFVFLGLALYAGYKWMTAQGNTKDVDTARDTLINATIGIILIVAAYAITNFIFTDVVSQIQ
ncbi:MAG: hypothetical protein A2848_01060 [Candidatus Magasanikbacteria bacterium RIFCSPHIGHO2_01_FULL_50_8]|uniref:DUF4190 domain-containing protein n=2 Tax=Candidatus Magasanikiibacteriota TaxID=1752731 RepID=A0A1F6LSA5_9BACT|nr:MAG: hypothetical protein A2848_01060 [Candidatus Magasanikbacteria bacterium RIFCSPHIGHO2_01_FULL_50_8]OGH67559.1 MAG: hypothetical protein A3C15_03290 [Candidatus Magasanikbacteria bacterium RIFCSPHIGHO2_02_FULL_50_9b]